MNKWVCSVKAHVHSSGFADVLQGTKGNLIIPAKQNRRTKILKIRVESGDLKHIHERLEFASTMPLHQCVSGVVNHISAAWAEDSTHHSGIHRFAHFILLELFQIPAIIECRPSKRTAVNSVGLQLGQHIGTNLDACILAHDCGFGHPVITLNVSLIACHLMVTGILHVIIVGIFIEQLQRRKSTFVQANGFVFSLACDVEKNTLYFLA